MSETSEITVVRAWHDAVNAGDADLVATLVSDDVEIIGPRGVSRGVAVMRDWATRAGITIEPGRWFQEGPAVVVEQIARWHGTESGERSEPITVASAFQVRGGLVQRVGRYETVSEALAAAGLDASAAVAPTAP